MSAVQHPATSQRPVIFGEVLYDVFPGEERVLGGAAFNVAWNLRGFGLDPLFISRVGRDEPGDRVIAAMEAWGLDTSGVQRDAHLPTGTVQVELSNGQPTFHILANQAYDAIDPDEATRRVEEDATSILYHGTLALRAPKSSEALEALRRVTSATAFCDFNLRSPWWDSEQVHGLLRRTKWTKLSDEELSALAPSTTQEKWTREHLAEARTALEIVNLIVTRGENGACLLLENGEWQAEPAPAVSSIADTVGAGDAFSAVMLLGEHRGWSPAKSLRRAVAFAASTCRLRGATCHDREFYSQA